MGSVHAVSGFDVLGLRVHLRVFVSGGESYSVECKRVELLCTGSGRRRNVACVLDCAEVRGLPARQIKSGWFPADDVDWSTTGGL